LIAALLAASAQADDVNISPVTIDFGRVKIGTLATVRVTFTNLTATQLQVAGGGGLAAPFSSNVGTCGGGIVPPSSTCYYNYSFRPTTNDETLVEDATSLDVTGGASPEYGVPIVVRGRGMGNLVDVAFTDVDFGDWFVGEQASVRLRIRNTHGAGVLLSGGGFDTLNGFGATGCGLGSDPLPAGEVCDFEYTFQPPALGFHENATSIGVSATDAPGVSQFFPIHVQGTGIGTVPLVGVSPVEIDYGDVTVGRRLEVLLSYESFEPGDVDVAGGGFNDNDDAFFGVGANDSCSGGVLPSGETCLISYLFRPTEKREFAAGTSLLFSTQGESQPTPLSFRGTGIGTFAQVSPVQIAYGHVASGTNTTVPVVITNTSDLPLTNFVGGGVVSPFSMTSSTCGSSLAVGASCQYNYRFSSFSPDPASAHTLISFTNTSGIQPTYPISLYANGAPEPGAVALGLASFASFAALASLRRAARRDRSASGVAKRRR
jgi:type 1 fimbria pilin